ncbi:hypothetical protein GCM10027612_19480 [Microbispora bryophytorum subsp. camponoti]
MADEETTIRLIRVDDAGVIAAHRARDRQAYAAREPAQPDEFYTEAGQRRASRRCSASTTGASAGRRSSSRTARSSVR